MAKAIRFTCEQILRLELLVLPGNFPPDGRTPSSGDPAFLAEVVLPNHPSFVERQRNGRSMDGALDCALASALFDGERLAVGFSKRDGRNLVFTNPGIGVAREDDASGNVGSRNRQCVVGRLGAAALAFG